MASSSSSQDSGTQIHALADLIHDLQIQVHALNSQLSEMRVEQERNVTETQELRRELDLAKPHGIETATDPPNPSELSPSKEWVEKNATTSVLSAPQVDTTEQRLNKLEDDQQVMEDKINDQYQTKVESGSKYRLRLSGIVLLNLYGNRGTVDNQDFPSLSKPPLSVQPFVSPATFGGSLRQSQIRLQTFGPDVMGARTSADVTMDFAGGSPDAPNGVVMGLVRLRTATVHMDWANTSIIAGQDRLFFAPLAPTSLATLAIPALAYSGNLWAWTPQLRIEHHVVLSENSSLSLQGGILDSLSGDFPREEYYRYPTWGELSGQPAYAARISWTRRMFGQDLIIGSGAYYGRQNWGFNRNVDGWAGTADLTLPLGKRFEFTGEFYRGRAIAGLGGGIGESVLLNGSFIDPATTFRGLDSMGGWAQIKFKRRSNFEINAALGLDNPFAGELRRFSPNSIYPDTFTRNMSPFINFIYQVRSDILFSTEYRHLNTSVLDSGSHNADHINVSLGYLF
ncbi:MAG TPA: hypothetical protein VHS29_13690 [Candidatus Acidoferrales bacterium]|nr:hypothetical protein [Candidatus Acidoferrales bacterium]